MQYNNYDNIFMIQPKSYLEFNVLPKVPKKKIHITGKILILFFFITCFESLEKITKGIMLPY